LILAQYKYLHIWTCLFVSGLSVLCLSSFYTYNMSVFPKKSLNVCLVLFNLFLNFAESTHWYVKLTLDPLMGSRGISEISPKLPRFHQNKLALRVLQMWQLVSPSVNPLVAFYDIHERKWHLTLSFVNVVKFVNSFVLSRTHLKTCWLLTLTLLRILLILLLFAFVHSESYKANCLLVQKCRVNYEVINIEV
jgi:hypothetical protein